MEQERLITFYLEALFLSLRTNQVFHLEKCRFDEKFVKWHMHREMNIILLRKSPSISCHTCFVCHFHQSITKVFEKNRLMIFHILMGLSRKYIRRLRTYPSLCILMNGKNECHFCMELGKK